jgi:hypothetical protein
MKISLCENLEGFNVVPVVSFSYTQPVGLGTLHMPLELLNAGQMLSKVLGAVPHEATVQVKKRKGGLIE